MLTLLTNGQEKIDDLSNSMQAQTSALKSINDTLIKITENQRQEEQKTSKIMNITQLNLEAYSDLTANILSLSNKTKTSLKEIGELIEVMSIRTNTTINKIEKMMETSFSQLQTSLENIANAVETLTDHTIKLNSDLNNLIKEQSNQTKAILEVLRKTLLTDPTKESKTDNESRIEGDSEINSTSLNVTTGECVNSCLKVADGDYQSCDTCHGYVSCTNNYIFYRNCPTVDLFWDDNKKRCEWKSETCKTSDLT
ncbi:uncharacterized protein LOC134264808 isoform X2 [Saccostrea cucullata]